MTLFITLRITYNFQWYSTRGQVIGYCLIHTKIKIFLSKENWKFWWCYRFVHWIICLFSTYCKSLHGAAIYKGVINLRHFVIYNRKVSFKLLRAIQYYRARLVVRFKSLKKENYILWSALQSQSSKLLIRRKF